MKKSKPSLKQRLCGVFLILLAVVFLLLAWSAPTVEDRDATAVLLVLPLGFYLLLTKKSVID